jgi:hypothetical protein
VSDIFLRTRPTASRTLRGPTWTSTGTPDSCNNLLSQYGTHAGCGTMCTSGHATKHGSTLHYISKHAAQLPNMPARRQLATTRDLLCGTCFATTCALSHCKHDARRRTLTTPPEPCARHRMRAAERKQRQRKLAQLACSCSQALVALVLDDRGRSWNCSSRRARRGPSARAAIVPGERGHGGRQLRSGGGLRSPPPLD